MKAMNFQDDIFSFPIDQFRDDYVPMFDLTSMQDATEKRDYPELVGKSPSLELNFTFPLENVTDLLVLGANVISCS